MPSKLQSSGVVAKAQNSPLGPGVVMFDVIEFTPQGILDVLAGDESKGLNVGLLTAAPTFNVSQETVNILDNVVGLGVRLQGSEQLTSQEVSVELEFAQVNKQNLEMAMPGLVTADWVGASHGSLTIGTGNSAYRVTAINSGVCGNSINIVQSTPSGGTTSVSVSSQTITIAPKTGETANGVIAAINAHATANDLVRAGRPSTSNGTGTVIAASSTPLAGGAAGSVIGEEYIQRGYWTTGDYRRNAVIALESTNTRVAHIIRVDNVISMDDFSYSANDDQTLAGVGMTLTATAAEADFNPNTGTYPPPFKWFKLNDVAV